MDGVPAVVSALVGVLVVLGAALALIGSVGLLRLRTFYERVHPPTMGTTLGVACIVLASVLLFSYRDGALSLEATLIAVFASVTPIWREVSPCTMGLP